MDLNIVNKKYKCINPKGIHLYLIKCKKNNPIAAKLGYTLFTYYSHRNIESFLKKDFVSEFDNCNIPNETCKDETYYYKYHLMKEQFLNKNDERLKNELTKIHIPENSILTIKKITPHKRGWSDYKFTVKCGKFVIVTNTFSIMENIKNGNLTEC